MQRGSADMLGSFAEMAALALGPLWLAGVALVGVWLVQYRDRKRRGLAIAPLLVHKRATAWGLATAVLGATLTLLVADNARRNAYQDAQRQFTQQVDRTESAISQEVLGLVKPLGAMRGAFANDAAASQSEFAGLVQALDLPQYYRGIRGIGYAERIASADLGTYLARQSRLEGRTATMRPILGNLPEPLDAHFRVQRMEPLAANREELGLDFASEPRRRAAMVAANI